MKGLRVGVPDNYYFDGVTPDVATGVREAVRAIEGLGTSVRSITVPDPTIQHGVANVIARAEGAVIHERLARERPHELQPAVRARLEVGLTSPRTTSSGGTCARDWAPVRRGGLCDVAG